jgi:hypothetical protein
MVMSENKEIYRILKAEILGKLIQRLISSPENILFMPGKPVSPGPAVTKPEGDPRMKHAEQELQHTVVEDTSQETVTCRHRTETVTMTQAETPSADFHKTRLLKTPHSQLLEITVGPYVVITLEEEDLDTSVHEILQSSKHPDIAFGYHITVLVPEIPHISQKIQSICFLRQITQKFHEPSLTTGRIGNLQTEMNIGNKICKASFCHSCKYEDACCSNKAV